METMKRVFDKQGNKWVLTSTITDTATVYKDLSENLIAKMNKASYVKSIRNEYKYNGFREVTVYTDNGFKIVYNIPTH